MGTRLSSPRNVEINAPQIWLGRLKVNTWTEKEGRVLCKVMVRLMRALHILQVRGDVQSSQQIGNELGSD